MSTMPQEWRDLAALLDPVGRCADPLAEGRSLDWYKIYALAAAQLVAPTLYALLAKDDRLKVAPIEVQDALAQLHRLNELRNKRQRAILRDTVRILNIQGIEPLLMKGSIALLPNQAPCFTTRMMSDLDIALHNAPPEQGECALIAAGYWHATNQGPAQFSQAHHLAPLFHPNGEGYVEIHREMLSDKIPAGALPLAAVCAAAEPVDWEGLRLRIPSIEHRIVHNALHSRVQDAVSTSDECSLRQLLEFVQLRASPAAAGIDWDDLLRRFDVFGMGVPIRVYLLLASSVFGQPLPDGVVLDNAIHRTERLLWFWLGHPRLFFYYILSKRLKRLPKRLITPSWYPQKWKQFRQDWIEKKPARSQ